MPSDAPDFAVRVVCRSVAPWGPHGGLERAVREQVDALRAAGCKVVLYTPTRGLVIPDAAVVDVPWLRLPLPRALVEGFEYVWWMAKAAGRVAEDMEPSDILYCHGASIGVLLFRPLHELPARTLHNPHGLEEFHKMTLRTFLNRSTLRFIGKRAARSAGAVISTDVSITPLVLAKLVVDASRVVLIPNSVNMQKLDDMAMGWSSPEPVSQNSICSIGRLVHNKGYDILARALVELHESGALPTGWEWIHFGSGPEGLTVRGILAAAGLEDHWRHREGAEDQEVYGTLAQSGYLCQPSRYEGSSLVTLEGMALRRVVVATPVGGIPDKIADGETGFLAREVSVSGLVDAFRRALAADGTLVGRRARQRVAQEFSMQATVRELEKVFAKLQDEAYSSGF